VVFLCILFTPIFKQENVFSIVLFFRYVMFFTILFLLLDKIHRPEVLSYPLISFLIVLSLSLFLPSILLFSLPLSPSTALITKFGYLIIIHTVVLIPLFYFWSKHRFVVSENKCCYLLESSNFFSLSRYSDSLP
jgi:hypothetical protein